MFHVTQRVSRNEFHETSPRNVNWFIVRVVAIMLGVSRYYADFLCSENVTIMLKEHHACSISIPPPPKICNINEQTSVLGCREHL